jgi:Uma2 family endonuclease
MATASEPLPTTEVASIAGFAHPASLLEFRHRITVKEFHRIIESGALGPEPHVELLEGVIVAKMSKTPPHNVATDLIQHLLNRLLSAGFFASMGNPVTIEDRDGEPEPDVSVLRGQIRDYAGRERRPADAALLIEASDTSYAYDRYQKLPVYAAAGVPLYWILDLNRRRLEVYAKPITPSQETPAYYAETRIYNENEEVPLILDGREVARFAVREILP